MRSTLMRWLSTAVLLAAPILFCPEGQAQPVEYGTLSGQVVHDETGDPLEGVHVFIAESMIGAATGPDGQFRLEHVPAGAHRLYASMVGFEPAEENVRLRGGDEYDLVIRLKPAVLAVPEVTVEARRDRKWERRVRRFGRLFLGESPNAEESVIENPEVLDFRGGLGWLRAQAAEPLIITNRALGYRVRYFLKEFSASGGTIRWDGEPLYEPLTPADEEEAARWEENRRKAYYGSFRHFILSVLAGTARAEGFDTSIRPSAGPAAWDPFKYPLRPETIIEDGPADSLYTLSFPGVVEIIYMREEEDAAYFRWAGSRIDRTGTQTSYIWLTDGPTEVDHTGEVLDPYGVTVSGYFAFERIADELPKEYRPE